MFVSIMNSLTAKFNLNLLFYKWAMGSYTLPIMFIKFKGNIWIPKKLNKYHTAFKLHKTHKRDYKKNKVK